MATSFPTGLDALTNPTGSSALTSPDHAGQHADANDAIEALEAKVGVNGSAVTTSLDYKVTNNVVLKSTFTTKGDILATSAASTPTRLAVGTNNQVLTADSSTATGVKWATPNGTLKWLGTNAYTATTTITPSTVSPNAKMAVITVIGSGGGSGGVAATTVSQVAVSQNGSNGGAVQAQVYNSAYYSTNCSTFASPWEITIGAGGLAGTAGNNAGGGGNFSKCGYPVGGKPYTWALESGGGSGGSGSAAATPPLYTTSNTSGLGSCFITGVSPNDPIITRLVAYTNSVGPECRLSHSYATSVTHGQFAYIDSPLEFLNTDYIQLAISPYNWSTRGYTQVVFTANSTSGGSNRQFGGGAASKVRLGTNATAAAGGAGANGLVVISWFG